MKTVQNGDRILVMFEGRTGGDSWETSKPFSEGKSKFPFPILVGANDFISAGMDKSNAMQYDGFEEQLIGMKFGDIRYISVILPETYPAHIASKVAHFKVEIVGM